MEARSKLNNFIIRGNSRMVRKKKEWTVLTSFFLRSFPLAKKWILVSTAVTATFDLGAAFRFNIIGLPGLASSVENLIETFEMESKDVNDQLQNKKKYSLFVI